MSGRTIVLLGGVLTAAPALARPAESEDLPPATPPEPTPAAPPTAASPATSSPASLQPGRVAEARRRQAPLHLDGRLDEPDWAAAPARGGFTQRQPEDGTPSQFHTEFRVLYDDDALYVGIRADDPDPSKIRALLTRRDEDSLSDWVGVGVDSYHDRRTAFGFLINPAGVQRDILLYDDNKADPSWNAVWQAKSAVDARGWSAELRIPLSQLRFAHAQKQTFGLNVIRFVARANEESWWVPFPQDSVRQVGLFGDLEGIRGIEPKLRFELLPYAVVGGRSTEAGWRDASALGNAGADVKYGVTSDLTVDGTVNPDFGQVEADPSQVNLSAYETFFAEKRPFFMEGVDIFRFHLGQGDDPTATETLFYSRRVGALPFGSPDDLDVVSAPDSTTIYGAAKMSGKLAGGLSLGVLSALTAEEEGTVEDAAGVRTREVIEPLASYNIVSVRQDLQGGRTNVGAAMTAVRRDVDGTGFEPILHDQAYTGGLQLSQLFWENNYSLDLKTFGSWVHGTPEALDRTQRSSRHYFQRPDAGYLGYDPSRTDLAGFGGQYVLGKSGGGSIRAALGGDFRSPGLELNDLGYQRQANTGFQWAWFQVRRDKPGPTFQRWGLNWNAWEGFDWQPQHLNTGGNMNGFFLLRSYFEGNAGYGVNFTAKDPNLLRGGPAMNDDFSHSAWMSFSTDQRRRVFGGWGGSAWHHPASDSWSADAFGNVTVQARSNLGVTVGLSGQRRSHDFQYVDQLEDASAMTHYVLAHIDQDTVGLTLRLNYTVSPTLSLQVYAQPYVSVGAYSRFKQATSPTAARYQDRYTPYAAGALTEVDGTLEVDEDGDGLPDYAFDKPDFSFRQLRSNVVVRWEYLPGSTLFAVWSHGRTNETLSQGLMPGHDLRQLTGADGEHVVMLKLTYWIGT